MCISINVIRLSQVVTQNHWYRNCRKRYFNMLTHTHSSASEYCYSLAYVSNQPNEVLITFFPLLIIDGLKVGSAWMASVIISITGTDSHGHMQLMAIANGTLGGIASSVSGIFDAPIDIQEHWSLSLPSFLFISIHNTERNRQYWKFSESMCRRYLNICCICLFGYKFTWIHKFSSFIIH